MGREIGGNDVDFPRRFHTGNHLLQKDYELSAGMAVGCLAQDLSAGGVTALFSDKGLLVERSLPTAGVKLLRHRTPRRDFLTTEQVQRVIDQAEHAGSNGAMLADLLKLLAYSGAREMEALRLRWPDVDFNTQRLHIGRDGQTKNREPRTVDFSTDLATHLRDMHMRKAPDSHGCFRRPNEQIARSMSIGRIPTRSGISAGDSRAFLTFNFTSSATTSRAGA